MIERVKRAFNSNLALLLIDWVSCASLFAFTIIYEVLLPPFQREFSLTDTTIQYSFVSKETVPMWLLWIIGIIIPIFIILACYLKVKEIQKTHLAIISFVLACGAAFCVTHFLKNLIGRLRPDFISRCQPSQTIIEETEKKFQLFTHIICTQNDQKIMRDGMQSFPSGHTSTAFSGLGFLSYYLNHILQLSHRRASLFQYYAVLIPLLVATFIGVSRIRDYRHHWQDVLAGGIIGMLSAYFSYTRYFKKRAYTNNNVQRIYPNNNALSNFNHSENSL